MGPSSSQLSISSDRSFTSVLSVAHAKPGQGAPEPPSMVRAQHRVSEFAPSRSLAACQSVDVGGGQGLATDPPVAAFHLFDQAKGDCCSDVQARLLDTHDIVG